MNVLNKSAKSIIIGWVIPFIIIPYCHAQQERRTYVPAQPMELHFRFDRTLPDSGYMDNIHVFNALDSLFSSHDTVPQKISSIHILAFASPDGNTAYNEQLAERRAINIKNYLIRKFPHIDTCRIHTCPQGENWQGLRRLVDERRHLPHRGQILYIIDNSNTGIQRKKALKLLESDSIHPYIRARILRSLRSAILQIDWEKNSTSAGIPRIPLPSRYRPESLSECRVSATGQHGNSRQVSACFRFRTSRHTPVVRPKDQPAI